MLPAETTRLDNRELDGNLWWMKKETCRYACLYNANWIKQIRAGKRGNTCPCGMIWIIYCLIFILNLLNPGTSQLLYILINVETFISARPNIFLSDQNLLTLIAV
jgi:hypothetical protein